MSAVKLDKRIPEFWRFVLVNAFKNMKHKGPKKPRWAIVSEVTMHGSGYSIAICEALDLDPWEKI